MAFALPEVLFARLAETTARHCAAVELLVSQIDRPAATIRGRCAEGDVFALFDPASDAADPPLAAAVITRTVGGQSAMGRLLAVDDRFHGTGLGSRLVRQLADSLRADGLVRMTAGPDDLDPDIARFLLQFGFVVT